MIVIKSKLARHYRSTDEKGSEPSSSFLDWSFLKVGLFNRWCGMVCKESRQTVSLQQLERREYFG